MNETEELRSRIIALLNNSPLPNAGKANYVLEFCKEAGLKHTEVYDYRTGEYSEEWHPIESDNEQEI